MKATETVVGSYQPDAVVLKDDKIILRRSAHGPFFFIKGNLRKSTTIALEAELSFEVKGREYSEAYMSGEWNGKEMLLYATKKTGMRYFPVGLLDKVRGIFDDFGVDYEVEYSPDIKEPININVEWKSKKTLYPDQKDAFDTAMEMGSGTIVMPTGTGKTVVALALVAALKLKTLIVVHRRELVNQWVKAIKEELGYDAGVVGSGKEKWKDITVSMIQTLYKRKEPIPEFDMLICDEAHHVSSRSLFKIAMKCNAAVRWGMSATPRRTDGAELKIFAALGDIIYESKPEGAIRKGRIVRPEFRFIETTHPRYIHRGMPFHEIYTQGITVNEDRNNKIVDQAKNLLAEGHTVYIHVEEIAHGKWLAGHIPGAEFVCGEDKKKVRDDIITRFSDGRLKICVATLLGEGVDIPKISALIMAGGKKAESSCIQKIGRALRTLPGKESAVVVDFKDKGVHLSDHFQERYAAYKKFYGVYCKDL